MTRQFAALITTCTVLAIPAQIHAQATAAGIDVRPEILRQLDGAWTMTGDVRGKPVTYRMVAKPALHGTFTELRMQDVQVPAQYEAAVFVGYDAASKTIIAHWMDSFGAKYSVPHGSATSPTTSSHSPFPTRAARFAIPGVSIRPPRHGSSRSMRRSRTARGSTSPATRSGATERD